MNMFDAAVRKLTAWYVAALLVIVIVFSLPIYGVATDRLEHASLRQNELFERRSAPPGYIFNDDFGSSRQEVLKQERQQLLRQIIFIDLIIVLAGAVASYFFAKHSLLPIKEAHLAQSRFTADASHELRTPLAIMQTEIEVALKDKRADKKSLSETLNSNLEEIARLKNLSDQLLLLTKIDRDDLLKTKVSLSKAYDKRALNLEKRYGSNFEKNIAPKVIVAGDEHLLSEVLTILIDNAVRYADKKHAKIIISLAKEHGRAQLSVQDNGAGISEEDLPNIFNRFYRGTKSTGDGHGLGLALAKEIVEKHGGSITAQNCAEGGAVFKVTLPLS